jgi:hypothetical protein
MSDQAAAMHAAMAEAYGIAGFLMVRTPFQFQDYRQHATQRGETCTVRYG